MKANALTPGTLRDGKETFGKNSQAVKGIALVVKNPRCSSRDKPITAGSPSEFVEVCGY